MVEVATASQDSGSKEVAVAVDVGEKCGSDGMPLVVQSYDQPDPFGGAQTFGELQTWAQSEASAREINELTYQFQTLVNNVMGDDSKSIAEKAAAVTGLSTEFQDMVANLQVDEEDVDDAIEGKQRGGLFGRLFGAKRNISADERKNAEPWEFAGPNRSFPIFKPEDVKAAVSSIGRSKAPSSTIKAGIIRIAKRKGGAFLAALPDAWKSGSKEEGGSFTSFKDADGHYRWLAVYSNNFYDRDGEVFTEKAHRDFIAWADKTRNYPELWLWHTPGSKVGKADMVDFADGLAIASGTFDPECEDVARGFLQDKSLGVSHGYQYDRRDIGSAGDYHRYRTFEVSPLPLVKAANEGTVVLSELEEDMELTKEKRDFLKSKLGEERVSRIEQNLGTLSKELKESGIGWKDFNETITEETPAVPAPAAADVSANTTVPASTAPPPAGVQPLTLDQIGGLFDEKLAPVLERVKELEKVEEERAAKTWEPRVRPTGQRPIDSNKAADGRTAVGKEAEEADKAAEEADKVMAGKKTGGDNWYLGALAANMVAPMAGE